MTETVNPSVPSTTRHASQFGLNVIYNLIGQGGVLVLTFVAARFMYKGVGPDAFGLVYFAIAVNTSLTVLLDLGLGPTTVRQVSAYLSVGRGEMIAAYLRTAGSLYWALYLVGGGAILIAAPWLVGHWLHLTSLPLGEGTRVLRILGLTALLALPRTLCWSALQGFQSMGKTNAIDLIASLVQQAGVVLLMLFDSQNLVALASWLAIAYVAWFIAYMVVLGRLAGWACLVPGFSTRVVSEGASFLSGMVGLSILAIVQAQTDKFVVSAMVPVGVFGVYVLATTIATRAGLVTSAISQASLPFLTARYKHERGSLLPAFIRIQKVQILISAPAMVAAWLAAGPVLTYVFGQASAIDMRTPVLLFCGGQYLLMCLNPPFNAALAVGQPQIILRSMAPGTILLIPLCIVLVRAFGPTGAGAARLLYSLYLAFTMVPRIESAVLQTGRWEWHRTVGLASVAAILAYALPSAYVLQRAPFGALPAMAAFVIGSAIYVAIASRILDNETRQTLRYLMRRAATTLRSV